jgi:hypothetical protein
MSRPLLGALTLVVLIFAVGYGLREWFLSEPPSRAELIKPAAVVAPAPEPAPPPPPPTAAPPTRMTVTSVKGKVELREAEAQPWQPLAVDARVGDTAALRTDDGSTAVLTGDDGVRLEVSAKSQIALTGVEGNVARVRLDSGRIAANVPEGSQRLQVAVRGSDAVMETGTGAFAVLRDDDGRVSVASTEGTLGLTARDHRVEVAAGQLSIVPVDGQPSKPSRIPASLFLKVSRSGPQKVSRRDTDLDGTTTPGAVVAINGNAVLTDAQGRFSTRVPLREGANSIEVVARDVLGRVQRQRLPGVDVDTKAPKLEGKTIWQ